MWSRTDPQGASQWLALQPEGEARQAAVRSFVTEVAWKNPELAVPWVQTLADETQRNNAIQNVARQWMQIDAAKARAWLETTSLPEAQKDLLLKGDAH
jgi:hypothetical protein